MIRTKHRGDGYRRSSRPWRRLIAVLALSLVAFSATVSADVWKRVDSNGVVHLSNRHMGKGSVLLLRSKSRRSTRQSSKRKRSAAPLAQRIKRLSPLIERTASAYRLDAALVHAVVKAESAYNPNAVSHKGAVGLMQLMPATAQRYGVTDRRDPTQNLTGGIRYLRDLLLQFRNVTLALAAYNAGEGAVARYGNKVPPYRETRQYVNKVIRFYHQFRKRS